MRTQQAITVIALALFLISGVLLSGCSGPRHTFGGRLTRDVAQESQMAGLHRSFGSVCRQLQSLGFSRTKLVDDGTKTEVVYRGTFDGAPDVLVSIKMLKHLSPSDEVEFQVEVSAGPYPDQAIADKIRGLWEAIENWVES